MSSGASDPRIESVQGVIDALRNHIEPYLPGGNRQMKPEFRPANIAKVFRDRQVRDCVIAFLRSGDHASRQEIVASLGLYQLPNGVIDELHNWLSAFRVIFIAGYRERILFAAENNWDLSDDTSIDPYLGGLNPFDATLVYTQIQIGVNPAQAREAFDIVASERDPAKAGNNPKCIKYLSLRKKGYPPSQALAKVQGTTGCLLLVTVLVATLTTSTIVLCL